MLIPHFHNKFKKDYGVAKKRGLDISLLNDVMNLLASEIPLPAKYKNHKLKGSYSGCWECHITPDWVLIYKANDNILELLRTGTHSDLF
jgi:mRNA interferase YafQ